MTKSECRIPKEFRSPNSELAGANVGFGFRISGFFRISDFDIRVS